MCRWFPHRPSTSSASPRCNFKDGCLGGDKNNLWITKGRRTIRFDIKIETPEGCVFAMYITRGKESEMGNVAAQGNNKTTMTFWQVHDRLGHMSDAAT